MHNGVVVAIARALAARGVLALRFNFRGVGASEGRYDDGLGEQFDLGGAVDWALAQPGVEPECLSLIGYSFGASVALAYAATDPRIGAVAAVSLPVEMCDAEELRSLTCPRLFVAGQNDQLTSPHLLRELVEGLPAPGELRIVAGTDHFWSGQELQLAELVANFVASPGEMPGLAGVAGQPDGGL
jgi:alpha/beta superfamily hydrolase